MMTILHWIRAAANAKLTPGCKAFCLELVPQMSSSTLSSHFSTSRMASKVSAALPSVKVYRKQLVREGLLRSGKGWQLTLPEEEKKSLTGICGDTKKVSVEISENLSRYTQGSQKGIAGDPKKVSPQIPVLYKGTSAFSLPLILQRTKYIKQTPLLLMTSVQNTNRTLETGYSIQKSPWTHGSISGDL